MNQYQEPSCSRGCRPQNSDPLNGMEIAMAYVPWQHFTQMYENLEKGYKAGTIFPELDKPFTGRRCIK